MTWSEKLLHTGGVSVYYGTTMKLVFHLHTGQLLQFLVSIRRLMKNCSPSTRIKIGGGCNHFVKYSHRVDHAPSSNTHLLLIPLIMKLLSTTV